METAQPLESMPIGEGGAKGQSVSLVTGDSGARARVQQRSHLPSYRPRGDAMPLESEQLAQREAGGTVGWMAPASSASQMSVQQHACPIDHLPED